MRRALSIVTLVCVVGGVLFARPGASLYMAESHPTAQQQPKSQSKSKSERKVIDFKADLWGPVAPGDSVMFFVGNFAAQHNGAVITCDSAVRYSADKIEFFGNVLINKNTTYIYGDRADYDGLLNEARVYSDIVKVIDGDATLYTYDFIFNTKTNIGTFGGGGVMLNRDNLLEADHGYYYADTKEMICVLRVEMRNDEYQMKGDSMIYNIESDHAYYFRNTNIWSADGDYLYADRGEYNKRDTLYKMTLNGYILTEKQEVWSDSIDYYRGREHAILRRDVQIDEVEHKTLAFGDYGEYWKNPGNALLTRRPSVISYDPEQPDSLYMRADSIFLYTIYTKAAEAAEAQAAVADSLAAGLATPPTIGATEPEGDNKNKMGRSKRDTLGMERPERDRAFRDTLKRDTDGLKRAGGEIEELDEETSEDEAAPELTEKQKRDKLREVALKEKAERKAAAAKIRDAKLDSIADRRQAKVTARLDTMAAQERRAQALRRERAELRLRKQQTKALRKGRELPDSSALQRLDSLETMELLNDSLSVAADSLAIDSVSLVNMPDSIDSVKIDTMYRLIKAYYNVRTFRNDFQSVCDSMVSISRDSTMHLYVDPVLWNKENQITSDVMDIYTENQQLLRAEFVGQPLMVSQIDTMHYNQVSGREMTAYFVDNSITSTDVNGHCQTLYYMQEEGAPDVQSMMVIDSGGITFYIDDQNRIYRIAWRNDVTWTIHPIDKIPAEQDLYLKSFKWEEERRPTRNAVFDRMVRPSEREVRSQRAKPYFPIYERIERDKIRFIERRAWSDRDDIVSPDADEWMRSLGFPTGQPRPKQ